MNTNPSSEHGSIPVDTFPEPLRAFIVETSDAIGCDPALVALPVLSTLAATIGATRNVMVRESWYEPCIIWTQVVAKSGSTKSGACDIATKPLTLIEAAEIKAASNASDRGPLPTRIVSDITRESLDCVLADNPRGVLLEADEASSFYSAIDRYGNGKSSDVGRWLSLWSAKQIRRHRATGDAQRVIVSNPHLSITGCMTPGGLADLLKSKHNENGLLARMFTVMPDPKPALWSERDPSDATLNAYSDCIKKLAVLKYSKNADDDVPISLSLSAEAKDAFVPFYNWSRKAANDAEDGVAGMLGKLAGQAARISMVFELVVNADATMITAESMQRAILLCRWFADERQAIDEKLRGRAGESDEELVVSIQKWCVDNRKPGMTASELRKQRKGSFSNSADAEHALNELTQRGLGHWQDRQNKNGRKTRHFVPLGLQRNLEI